MNSTARPRQNTPNRAIPPHPRLGPLATLRSLLGGPGYHGPRSDHFDGERFFNPVGSTGRSFADVMRWRRTAQRKPWPQWVENKARPELPPELLSGRIGTRHSDARPTLVRPQSAQP